MTADRNLKRDAASESAETSHQEEPDDLLGAVGG
jgi:hypothetical protein